MEKFGSLRYLKGSARESFMHLFAEQIIREMNTSDDAQNWNPSSLFGQCAVAFVGGGGSYDYVAVTNHSGHDILLSRNKSYPPGAVKEAIRCAINQGEGERMSFSTIYCIAKLVCLGSPGYIMNTTFDI